MHSLTRFAVFDPFCRFFIDAGNRLAGLNHVADWRPGYLGFQFPATAGDAEFIKHMKEPNQPSQRNASTGSVLNFESPARRG